MYGMYMCLCVCVCASVCVCDVCVCMLSKHSTTELGHQCLMDPDMGNSAAESQQRIHMDRILTLHDVKGCSACRVNVFEREAPVGQDREAVPGCWDKRQKKALPGLHITQENSLLSRDFRSEGVLINLSQHLSINPDQDVCYLRAQIRPAFKGQRSSSARLREKAAPPQRELPKGHKEINTSPPPGGFV